MDLNSLIQSETARQAKIQQEQLKFVTATPALKALYDSMVLANQEAANRTKEFQDAKVQHKFLVGLEMLETSSGENLQKLEEMQNG